MRSVPPSYQQLQKPWTHQIRSLESRPSLCLFSIEMFKDWGQKRYHKETFGWTFWRDFRLKALVLSGNDPITPESFRNYLVLFSEEDKRAKTNVQNGLVFFFLFSFILFYYLWTKTEKVLEEKKKLSEKVWKVWKSAKKCEKVPRRFCPLVVAL